jgi:transposase
MDDYWAKPVVSRNQAVLFTPTLDDSIPEDHPIRLWDELLRALDWSEWECQYDGRRGQPPIHPRLMAGAILYGLSRKIRSSRQLEDACENRKDFGWLLEGRQPDHSTFAKFRTKHRKGLKSVFRQLNERALRMGWIHLAHVATDGTRIAASSNRQGALTASKLRKRLEACDAAMEEALCEVEQQDAAEEKHFGSGQSANHLPAELASAEARRQQLQRALETAEARDQAKQQKDGANATAVRVPVTDPDSQVLPNKEGGYRPNYTPVATVDDACGILVSVDVIASTNEAETVIPALEEIQQTYGKLPQQHSADAAFGEGKTLQWWEEHGVEGLVPMGPDGENPARRGDFREPVPQSQWESLPRRGKRRKLAREAFIYDAQEDCYWCPLGQPLKLHYETQRKHSRGTVHYRQYRRKDCGACPLAESCLSGRAKGRTLCRDQYESHRERMVARMAREESQKAYRRRWWIAETPFGYIKGCLGIRQFLLRGIEKVKTEWCWISTACNLAKMVRLLAAQRARLDLNPSIS